MEYSKALNYTRKVISSRDLWKVDLAEDVWHDTWLYYFNKTGKNLLDEHPGFIARAIKWRLGYEYRKEVMAIRGNEYRRSFYDLGSITRFKPVISENDPLATYLTKEFYKNLYQAISDYKKTVKKRGNAPVNTELLRKIVDYLDQGYTQAEIAGMMSMSDQRVSYLTTRLKSIVERMEFFSSPFNSNRLPIKSKVKRATYDANPEKYSDYVFDTDRWSDANESYTQLTHKTENYGLLIVEGKTLDL